MINNTQAPVYIQQFGEEKNWKDPSYAGLLKQFADENVVLKCSSKQCHFPPHKDNLSLKITMKGREYYAIDNKQTAVDQKRFFIVNAQQEHESWVDSDDYVQSLTFYFTNKFVNDIFNSLLTPDDKLLDNPFESKSYPLYFFQQLYNFEDQIFQDLTKLKFRLENEKVSDEELDQHLRYMLYHLLYIHRKDVVNEIERMPAIKRSTKIEIYRRLHWAKDYIETFYARNISLEELSGVAMMSENQLLRHFKNTFHTTPHQYLVNKRLEFAKTLLKTTRKPVGEIIISTGFEDLSSFGRLFKKHFSITPAAYRQAV